jgi:hypothetical protein
MLNKTSEVRRRLQKAYTAFGDTVVYWVQGNSITLQDKMMLYNAIVLPHFIYCIGSFVLFNQLRQILDKLHRRQLRFLTGKFYPSTIRNGKLYRLTKSKSIGTIALIRRWKQFRKFLLYPEDHQNYKVFKAAIRQKG